MASMGLEELSFESVNGRTNKRGHIQVERCILLCLLCSLCVENYTQSALVCPELDTHGYFVRNVQHTSQSANECLRNKSH